MVVYAVRIIRKIYKLIFGYQDKVLLISHAVVPGSMGDQAMLDAAANYLKKEGFNLSILYGHKEREVDIRLSGASKIFVLPKSFVNRAKYVHALISSDEAMITGADVIDGIYHGSSIWIDFLQLASDIGVKVRVLGFSFSSYPVKKAVEQLKDCSNIQFMSRDINSLRRFESYTEQKAKLVADVAFLLEPELSTEEAVNIQDFILKKKQEDAVVAGVNVSGHVFSKLDESALTAFIKTLNFWLEMDEKHCIILVPHDVRDEIGDLELLRKIYAALERRFSDRVKLLEFPTAWNVKALAGNFDFAISARMHFTIACMGMGVPALSLVYQDKFEGLEEHFKLDNTTIEPTVVANPEVFQEEIISFQEKSFALKNKIKNILPSVIELSKQNFR